MEGKLRRVCTSNEHLLTLLELTENQITSKGSNTYFEKHSIVRVVLLLYLKPKH